MNYQLADEINGRYGEVFTDKEVAEKELADAIEEGKRINLENSYGEFDTAPDGQEVEDFIGLVAFPDEVSIEAWEAEFKKLSQAYMSGINWDAVVFESGEFAQAAEDIQLKAYMNCRPDDSDISLDDWEAYSDSNDLTIDFEFELKERYEAAE